MTSREIVDLDLARARDGARPDPGARLVVRHGDTVLGQLPAPVGRARRAPLQRAVAASARRLFAESVVRAAPVQPSREGARALPGAGDVTVVVCTRDRPALLEGCLAALQAQRSAPAAILVVDNAPRDPGTRRVAEAAGVAYVVEPRPGLDNARNTGLSTAASAVVAYTDDDARPEPGWVEGVARGFGIPEVGCVTGPVVPAELATPAQALFEDVYGGMAKGYELRLFGAPGQPHALRPERIGTGCNMAFRREALQALGGFDPALDVGTATGGGGDLDAFVRVLEAGWAIEYRPDAVVRHLHRRTEEALERQVHDNGRAYAAVLFASFLRGSGARRARPVLRYGHWLAAWHARRSAHRLLRRERLPARYLAAELRGAVRGPGLYLRARREAAALERGDG